MLAIKAVVVVIVPIGFVPSEQYRSRLSACLAPYMQKLDGYDV